MDWTPRRIHKWIAVSAGLFLLVWLISGAIMLLPLGGDPPWTGALLDLAELKTSALEAVAAVERESGQPVRIRSIAIRRIGDTPVYEIVLAQGGSRLIDTRTGRLFRIDGAMAERLALGHAPLQSRVVRRELVERHGIRYPAGPLPVFRIVFDSDPSVAFYVSGRDGAVQRSTPWTRISRGIGSLHTFQPLLLVIRDDGLRKTLLLLSSVVAIAAAVTGYYLALPKRLR